MVTDAQIESLIREVIEPRLKGVKIDSIKASRGIDSDGEAVIEISVIFEAKTALDAAKVVSLVRHLRPKLMEVGEPAFPLMSFISKKDARKLGFEAA